MQQHDFDALIHGKEQTLNKLEREEVLPRYKFASPPYYKKEHEDEKLKKIAQNFEPHIHFVVEQEAITQGIKMSRGVELILVIK